ncbi:MAG: hypothetical protein WDM85_08215 [Caulobacteraceae bacterium]
MPGVIDNAYGALTFSPDSAWLYWVWRDENARPSKVFRGRPRGAAPMAKGGTP